MHNAYFAASNSMYGFQNYYDKCFEKASRLYIIKGGPGTGKSSLMRAVARYAEGRGLETEYYYCSSDPTSLDGVLILSESGYIGLIDGTPPHTYEPGLPGARENIIDLGHCWDENMLASRREEIAELARARSLCFVRAYDYLRSCGNLRAVIDSLCGECINTDKLLSAVRRLAKFIPDGEKGSVTPALCDSVSMSGRVRFDTYEKRAKQLFIIGDIYGTGAFFMNELYSELEKKQLCLRVSFDPVCPHIINAVFEENTGAAFVLSDERMKGADSDDGSKNLRYVNIRRFLNLEKLSEYRQEIRYATGTYCRSLEGAVSELSEASKYHFELEEIYKKAMDFRRVDEMMEELCKRI